MRPWLAGRRPAGHHKDVFDRYTGQARQAVAIAQDEARRLGHPGIGTEHLLLGLIGEGEGVAARALRSLGMTLEAARQQAAEITGPGRQPLAGYLPLTPGATKVLQLSLREGMRLGHLYVGPEHVLLSLLRQGDGGAVEVMANLGLGVSQVHDVVLALTRHSAEHPGTLVPGPGDCDERIAGIRRRKSAAPGADEVKQAAAPRDLDTRLATEQARKIEEWSAAVDVIAMGEEFDRLHGEVSRLRALLVRYGIEPGSEDQRTA